MQCGPRRNQARRADSSRTAIRRRNYRRRSCRHACRLKLQKPDPSGRVLAFMELETRNSKLDTAAPLPELLRCPRCKESKPADEFGICRERKNGRNLYCKPCIRAKINAHRAALREYKAARLKRINQARAEAEARNKSARDHLKPHDCNPADELRTLDNASPADISRKIAPALPLAFLR